MRVVEPRHFDHLKKERKRRPRRMLLLLVLPLLAMGLRYAWFNPPEISRERSNQASSQVRPAPAEPVENKPKAIKTFTGNDFKLLFQSLAHPNTQPFLSPPVITGDAVADARIRTIAEKRGYKLTTIPVSAIVRADESDLGSDDLLQPLAYRGWTELKSAAEKDSIPLQLFSGYRSPEFQRDLFLERLYARGITLDQIARGAADGEVEATLVVTAVPGYSRHHSGYTADFRCEDGSPNFGASICFRWLNDNNYARAKQFGWIPSYPEEAESQGPEPEPWEYIWVGIDALSE